MRHFALALIAATTTAATAAEPTIPSAAELITGIAPQDDAAIADEAVEEKSPWTGTVGLGLNASKTDTKTLGFNANAAVVRDLEGFVARVKASFLSLQREIEAHVAAEEESGAPNQRTDVVLPRPVERANGTSAPQETDREPAALVAGS